MSNYEAIATVTAALQDRIINAFGSTLVSGVHVFTTRPDLAAAANKSPWVNIFLYQVTPNAAYRNDDLPTRRSSNAQLVNRPQAALVLHYLISVFGDDSTMQAHRMLGAVVRDLHAQPVLRTGDVKNAISTRSFLADSNLDQQHDLVRMTPSPLTIEELSKLWSTFFEIPYILSVAYEAGAVLIEPDDAPATALPVKKDGVNVRVIPFSEPRIDGVEAQTGKSDPIFLGTVLLIRGIQLKGGDDTVVLLSGEEFAPDTVTDTLITLTLKPPMQAGVQGVQVLQKIAVGNPAVAHKGVGFHSNLATFVLHPKLVGAPAVVDVPVPGSPTPSKGVQVNVDVTVGPRQRVILLLNASAGSSNPDYSFVCPATSSNTITVATPGVNPGSYLVRVQIDGANSDIGPTVTM